MKPLDVALSYYNIGVSLSKKTKGDSITLETSLICILLSASRDVHFNKRMICFLSDLL